jgi:hypothetical protein
LVRPVCRARCRFTSSLGYGWRLLLINHVRSKLMTGFGKLPRLRLCDCTSAKSSDVEGDGECSREDVVDSNLGFFVPKWNTLQVSAGPFWLAGWSGRIYSEKEKYWPVWLVCLMSRQNLSLLSNIWETLSLCDCKIDRL